jgi:hypothetical protein
MMFQVIVVAGPARTASFSELSFIRDGKWAPRSAANYAAECRLGRKYAGEMLAMIEETGNPLIYSGVMRAVVTAGRFGGIEIGFCQAVSEAVI